MASSLNLQNTINWALPFLRNQPLAISGQEPALTIANLVLQMVLGPPFCWRFNRNTVNITCTAVAGGVVVQDYTQALSDFGFIEQAWLAQPGSPATDIKPLEIQNCLGQTAQSARPKFIAAQNDDNAGNITFRLMDAPDLAYPVTVLYQKKAQLMQSLAASWAPLPDEYSFIYQPGFLALAMVIDNDPRFPIFEKLFVSRLLGVQDGLDEMKKNLFLGNWFQLTQALQRAEGKTNQGIGGRAQ